MTFKKINVIIENKIYDLTSWVHKHPGGVKIIEEFNNKDCTDYFYAIHSNKARTMLKQFKTQEIEESEKIPPSKHMLLMKSLETQGFFDPNYCKEACQILHTVSLCILASFLNFTNPFLASICLGFGFLTALWSAHSMEHSRNSPMKQIGHIFSYLILGYSSTWWNNKHTRHHLSTNEVDYDCDIQLMPIIYLWAPTKKTDSWMRPFQKIYFSVLYTALHIKWKFDSVWITIAERKYYEISLFIIHYIWLFSIFSWRTHLFSLVICGTLLSWIVSSSHQSEEKLFDKVWTEKNQKIFKKYQIHDYAEHQLKTTRNINIQNDFIDYVCGGMQYQIEHHLFPRVPLYNLPKIKPIVQEFCKDHGYEYKEESIFKILSRNARTICHFADMII